ARPPPHRDRHRAADLDGARRRPHPRPRRWEDRGARHPRGAPRLEPALQRDPRVAARARRAGGRMRPGMLLDMMAQDMRGKARGRRQVTKRLLGELKPYKRTVAEALIFVVVTALGQAAGPWLVARAIDHDIFAHDGGGLLLSVVALFAVYAISALA